MSETIVPNIATDEGRELGKHLARFCDKELEGKPDGRCATCAFRKGEHLANGSPATLMDALKCVAEKDPFYCHEEDKPCAGWVALSAGHEKKQMPWEFVGGVD